MTELGIHLFIKLEDLNNIVLIKIALQCAIFYCAIVTNIQKLDHYDI